MALSSFCMVSSSASFRAFVYAIYFFETSRMRGLARRKTPDDTSTLRFVVVSACQKIDIYVNPKNKWCFKIAKNFQVR